MPGIKCPTVRSGGTTSVRSALMPTLMISRASMEQSKNNKSVVPAKRSASRDPYSVIALWGTKADAFQDNQRRWLWVPAFAGTTNGERALLLLRCSGAFNKRLTALHLVRQRRLV